MLVHLVSPGFTCLHRSDYKAYLSLREILTVCVHGGLCGSRMFQIVTLFSLSHVRSLNETNQGCAEMTSRVPPMGARTEEEQVMEFSVKWLRLCELPFQMAIQVCGMMSGLCFAAGLCACVGTGSRRSICFAPTERFHRIPRGTSMGVDLVIVLCPCVWYVFFV